MLESGGWSADRQHGPDELPVFRQGQILYEQGKFKAASEAFSSAVEQSPDHADYHHWLAKAYGRIAENASWFTAVRLARKVRVSLERAVALDPHNVEALADLLKYYQQAPSFLGGNEEKVKAINKRLEVLQNAP